MIWKQDHSSFSLSWSCNIARNLCGCFSNEIIHLLDKIIDSATFFSDRSSIHKLIWWYGCMQNRPNWTTLPAANFDLKLDLDEFLYLKKNYLRLAQTNLFMAKVLTYFVLSYPESISLSTLKSCKSLHSRKSFVLGELSFARMPSRQYCLKMNRVHSCNWWPELVNCGQWQPWGVVTQHGMTQILGHPKLLQKLNAPYICRN